MRLLALLAVCTLVVGVPVEAAGSSAPASQSSPSASVSRAAKKQLAAGGTLQHNDSGTLRLPSFFADFMVLQRQNATVWGWANAGAEVQLQVLVENGQSSSHAQHRSNTPTRGSSSSSFSSSSASASSASASASSSSTLFNATTYSDNVTGQFLFQVVGVPSQLNTTVVVRSASSSTTFRNVAWGDVFLCSGQSNMQYPMADAFNGASERADHADFPELRMLTLKTVQATSDAQDVPSLAPYVWAPSSISTISPRSTDGSFGTPYPSAACFYAVRELLRNPPVGQGATVSQTSFPVGIITAAVGGTPIEKWMTSSAILDGTPAFFGGNGTCGGTVTTIISNTIEAPGNASCNPDTPGVSTLYHGMIAPLLPMRLSAVLWYQGEENDHTEDACYGPQWYRCLFPSMIQSWRDAFHSPNLPFLYVLLAGGHTAVMREAQFVGAQALPLTAFATAMDLGAYGDEFLIPGHPPRKQEVGRRLSLILRSLVYNRTNSVPKRGPRVIPDQVRLEETSFTNKTLVATIPFALDSDAVGTLHFNSTGSCSTADVTGCCRVAGSPASWVVAFANPSDGTVYAATNISLDAASATIVATVPMASRGVVGSPVSPDGKVEVRVLFDNNPTCALYSGSLSGPDSVYAANPHYGLVAEMWRAELAMDPI